MRYPAVAGTFYPGNEKDLRRQIEECFNHRLGPGKIPVYKKGDRNIKGAVVPHAGYVYSGPIAAHVYSALADDGFPETFIIIGPNHTGYGSGVALTTESFNTPLGDADVNKDLAKDLLDTIIDIDINAHRYEHSIEVQLPFLQYIKKDFSFVPVCMGMQDYKTAKEVGSVIKDVIKGRDVAVIASSDFTHYEPKATANKKDKMAIDAILELDSKKLFEAVKQNNITMCGYGPVISMLEAVNGKKAALLKYATSGDIQPMNDVVGYAGIIVK
ncbi:MAG: MEMO1 family protein [Thermoplasmatales archaeon]|nr:MEMO1 family protein [Thermoplasmatales archaeon]